MKKSSLLPLIAPLLLLAGCVVSPQPSPPSDEPSFDGDGLVVAELSSMEDLAGIISFTAGPGTVDPGEGDVIVTNLANADAPSVASVSADGSFTIALAGQPNDVIRFQVKQGDLRSEPFDVAIDATTQGLVEILDTPSCLVLEPTRHLPLDGEGDSRSVLIRNECETRVTTQPPRLRRGEAGFTFTPTQALVVEPGEVGIITVTSESAAGELEDVLLLDIVEPEPTRRAVTLTLPD